MKTTSIKEIEDEINVLNEILRAKILTNEFDALRYRWLLNHSGLDFKKLLGTGDFMSVTFYIDYMRARDGH